ncbi:hypothetical protein [Halostella litorea]|uniref:hypothetical protein n=1 Tax=Halostella litorea TaxID=2528831 RepID=UPI001092997F|nr:hypothetical protein [Halostella litorea]
MGFFDSLGALASSIVAALVMLVFAIVSFYITVFIVGAGASFAGYDPGGGFVTLAAAVLAGAAIVAGSTPLAAVAGEE